MFHVKHHLRVFFDRVSGAKLPSKRMKRDSSVKLPCHYQFVPKRQFLWLVPLGHPNIEERKIIACLDYFTREQMLGTILE